MTLRWLLTGLLAVETLWFFVGLAACASSPEMTTKLLDVRGPEKLVSAHIVEDTVALVRSANGAAFRVTAVMRNRSNRLLFVGGRCQQDAQVQAGESWRSVWAPVCVGVAPVQRIQPGDSLSLQIAIYGFFGVGIEPHFDPKMSHGTFRIMFAVTFHEPVGDSPRFVELPSSTFVVADPSQK